jgi:hypothetical protein
VLRPFARAVSVSKTNHFQIAVSKIGLSFAPT